jgi:UDP-2,3-diacylglucosamine pyrophosphatase LpxH
MARLAELQELRNETTIWRESTSLHVDTGGYPYFYFHPLSDVHIGHQGVDHQALLEHLAFIKRMPVTTALVGDVADFFLPSKHPDGMLGDVITPDDQLVLWRRFMEEYKEKLLGVVQDPSHVDWARRQAGIEPYRWMTLDLEIPLLESGGHIDLTVNDQRYKIVMFHQVAKYNSSFNRTHSLKRMRELHVDDADVVIGGHVHIGAMEKAVHREGKPYFVQLGTFKTEDGFGTRGGYVPRPQVFFPTLVFDGRKHNVEAIEDLDAGEEFIHAMDAFYKTLAVGHLGYGKRKRR